MLIGGLGLKRLELFCGQMHQMLAAGIPIQQTLDKLSQRGIRRDMRPLMQRVSQQVSAGETLSKALENQGRFPRLLIALVSVAEKGGNMDGVFRELSHHYSTLRRIRSRFLAKLTLPAIQIFLVIGILSIVRYIMVLFVQQGTDAEALAAAAAMFFGGWGLVALLLFGYWFVTRVLAELQPLQTMILRIPMFGTVRFYFALARFSWTMEMMVQAGGNIVDSLQMALYATANGAFSTRGELVRQRLVSGDSVTEALDRMHLFPEYYLERITVAEESGDLEHTFGLLADEYFEKAENLMHAISVLMYWLVYGGVAVVVIVFIFKFFMMYVGALSGLV